MVTEVPTGRRERKKAATRQAIADAALELFLARGFDAVSMRDIADAADVSTTTIFKHFTGKEALVFDRDEDLEAALVGAVRDREPGTDVLEALREHALRVWGHPVTDPELRRFTDLVAATPALQLHWETMWTRHAEALAAVVAAELGRPVDDPACSALARFVLQVPTLASASPDPVRAVGAAFDVLARGWVES